MTRTILIAAAVASLTALQGSPALAQSNPLSLRQDEARQEARQGRRLELSDIVRRVSSGRQGRLLGARPAGDVYVVRWEYPGGRVADITVDARTGDILGER